MHTTGSYLLSVLDKVRFFTDETTLDAKYDNNYIIRNFIIPAIGTVLSRVNLNQDDPIVVRHAIQLVVGQEFYVLPPCVQEVWRFAIMDAAGKLSADAYPRGEYNPFGPGWRLEGNMLSIRPFPVAGEDVEAQIWYVPTGDVNYHYHTGGATVNADGTEVTLSATPTYGDLDRRPNAYAGQILRMLDPNGKPWDERVIDSYDMSTRKVTLRVPLDSTYFSTSSMRYEIAPIWLSALTDAVSLSAASQMAVGRKMSGQQLENLKFEYQKAIKTVKDNFQFKQLRTGKSFHKNTTDNPERTWGTWTSWSYTQGP